MKISILKQILGKRKWQLNRKTCRAPHPGARLEKTTKSENIPGIKKLDTAEEIMINKEGQRTTGEW